MAETSKAPATTDPSDWVVPNQDKIEQVIDARLAKNAAAEKRASSRSSSSSDKS